MSADSASMGCCKGRLGMRCTLALPTGPAPVPPPSSSGARGSRCRTSWQPSAGRAGSQKLAGSHRLLQLPLKPPYRDQRRFTGLSQTQRSKLPTPHCTTVIS